jgi:hypothetical protein
MIIPATPPPSPPSHDRLRVLATTLPVTMAAPQVVIDTPRAAVIAAEWSAAPWPDDAWDTSLHFFDNTERTLNWMALLDALNFCFWGEPGQPRWRVHWHGAWHDGYNALAAALSRAVEEGYPLWDAAYLARMSTSSLADILRPDPDEHGAATPIPLFDARLAHTRELGQVLLSRFDGSFANVIQAAHGDAVALALLVADAFPSFHDVAIWKGQEVRFFKRAQILASDIASAFRGRASADGELWQQLTGLDELTAFADYKVPQLLRRLGILTYAADLAARLDRLEAIPAGSPDEVAIRAATIWGVEVLRRALADHGVQVTSSAIDYRLWLAGQTAHDLDRPYHRTRTIYY